MSLSSNMDLRILTGSSLIVWLTALVSKCVKCVLGLSLKDKFTFKNLLIIFEVFEENIPGFFSI